MRSSRPQDEAAISISYLHVLVGFLIDRGVTQSAALHGTLISPAILQNPEARISPRQLSRVFNNGVRATGEAALAYEVGLRMKPSTHGFLGFATLASPSMDDALHAVLRYCSARQHVFDLRLRSEGAYACIELQLRQELEGMERFFHESFLVGMAKGAADVLGIPLPKLAQVELCLAWPEPPYHARYGEKLPVSLFDQAFTGVRFPSSMLALRPALSDECAFRQAIKPCEQELARFGDIPASPVQRVRQCLVLNVDVGYPSMEAIAERLHMSSRNLSRQLQREGFSYLALLEEARQRDAKDLLCSDIEVQEIATRLGYLNPANFTRAFRKWTNESPSAYRMRHAG